MTPKRAADKYVNVTELKKYASEKGITLTDAIGEIFTDFIKNIEEVEPKDPLYEEAIIFISKIPYVTISLFQRKFSINFDRAIHLINQLERTHYLVCGNDRKYKVIQERYKQ